MLIHQLECFYIKHKEPKEIEIVEAEEEIVEEPQVEEETDMDNFFNFDDSIPD